MKKSELRQMIKEELLKEEPKWITNNLSKDFYDLYASADCFAANLGHFMDDMNTGKTDNAYFSLKVADDELSALLKYIKKYSPKIKQELKSRLHR